MSVRWGSDPVLRWLRVISVVAFLALIVIVVIDPIRSANFPVVALLCGAILLQLGYEVVVPGLTNRRNHDEPVDEERRK